ncbi:MAG: phosphoribosylglycinamide formyltransferase [Polyangiaceae bacterium]|nr:phosphoribosylglycinamide formyltransferase [Myxococcales bacterium]MCB9589079.1 phosphoribosylglycinamide formyltransferase [Polyangiaceae bacterium]
MTLKLGVLVSGRGSNLQAILDACDAKSLDAEVRLVLSNRSEAQALERARAAGVATRVLDHKTFPNREAFDAEMLEILRGSAVEWVVLAGFMRLLTPLFIDGFRDRIINVHPSLLPAFPGVRAQAQALEYGVRVTGCTVHFVDQGTDTGPIIDQRAIPIGVDESLESVEQRLLVEEHALLVDVLKRIASGSVQLDPSGTEGRRKVRSR